MNTAPYIVVTGAHGFVGNHILEKLLMTDLAALLQPAVDTGASVAMPSGTQVRFSQQSVAAPKIFDVWAVDLPESAARATAHRFAQSSRVKIVFHKELVSALRAAPQPPLAVIHNGACSSTVERDPAVFAELNVGASQALWNYCAENGVPFIYASSAAVYGDGLKGFSDLPENSAQYRALNLYGQSKLDFDLWALEQPRTPPMWFGLRYFNVYGPFESHKGGQASMVFHGYQQATRTGVIRLFKSNTPEYTDGNQLRDFVYVKDIVKVTLHLLGLALRGEKPVLPQHTRNGCFLNVGTGATRSWNDLAESVFDALSLPRRIEYIEIPENISGQYQNYTCADLSVLRQLGYRHSFTPLKEGVREYVQRYLMRGL
ncbi:MAG: hypothetical protein RI932_1430 [Pseudomonadota bacterium]